MYRDKTVDILKGFAIFLIVMGHFLAAAISHIDGNTPHNGWLVGQWIYSFYMPLFFFLSGYLSVKAPASWVDLGCKVVRKVQTLLVPGLAFMLLEYWFSGTWSMAWFLKVLFQLTVVFACVRFAAEKMKLSLCWELVLHGIVFAAWFVGSHFIKGTWAAEHLWIHNAAARYPYIVLGYVFARQDWNKVIQEKNWLLSGLIIGYAASYYIANWVLGGSPASYMREYIVAPIAVMAIFALAKRISVDNIASKVLCYMGQKSLAIYLLSGFFLISLPQLADWWILQDTITSIVVQLVTSIVASAVCVALCLAVEWVISQSKILNFVCFGKSIRK